MSDVTVAPNATPTPSNEVPVNVDQGAIPSPVGSQAPQRDGLNERQQAIQRAFDRANERSHDPSKQPRPAQRAAPPKPAEAKEGHNQPPAPTEKFDLKKRPVEDQPRDRGRFAPRQADNAPENAPRNAPNAPRNSPNAPTNMRNAPGNAPANAPANAQPARQLPDNAPYRNPPPRMAEHAKRDWHATPATIRGEINRMHQEFGSAYNQYRGDYETMNSIRPFHQLATQHGTTLQKALTNYVGMETKLRTDLIGGLDTIINNLNLRTPDGQQIGLRDVAYHILNMSPDQHRLTQAQNAQSALHHQIGQLHQTVNVLAQNQQRMQFTEQFRETKGNVDRYAEAHPRLDELADLIEQEINLGFNLDTAYKRATLLRPTQAAQTRAPSAQTRSPDKSIHGSPSVAPSNGALRRPGKQVGRREAIQNAINRMNGSL
jgi:hypothetical protein